MLWLALAIACPAVVTTPATSIGTVIDFESMSAMSYLSGYPIPEAARLSNQLANTDGIIFSSGAPYVAVDPQNPELPAITDSVSVRGDLWADSGSNVTAVAAKEFAS